MKVLKKLGKAGQVASLILLSVAVLLFLGSAGIFYAQKKIMQTRAMISADTGAMFLASNVGSYAHYLCCKALNCKCKKKKKRWGMIIGLPLIGIGGLLTLGGYTAAGLAIMSTGGSLSLQDEIQTRQAMHNLGKLFNHLSDKEKAKEMLKWSTIMQVAQVAVDPEMVGKVIPDIEKCIKSGNCKFGQSVEEEKKENALAEEIRKEILNIYGRSLEWITNVITYHHGHYPYRKIGEAIKIWDELVGGKVIDRNFYVEVDEDTGEVFRLSSLAYVAGVLFYADGGEGVDLSLRGFMKALKDREIDGISALEMLKEWDRCNPSEEDCDDEDYDDFYTELQKVDKALQQLAAGIQKYDLVSYGIVRICLIQAKRRKYPSYRTRKFFGRYWINPQKISSTGEESPYCKATIKYKGAPYYTLEQIKEQYSFYSWVELFYKHWWRKRTGGDLSGKKPAMTPDDYNNLKQDILRVINHLRSCVKLFMRLTDQLVNRYKNRIDELYAELMSDSPNSGDYMFSWTDRMGRKQSIVVDVSFKVPRFKKKKKLFKIKIKVKNYKQTVKVKVCRNNYCYRTEARYNAKRDHGPNTGNWWLRGVI